MTGKVASIVPVSHLNLIRDDEYFMALSYAFAAPGYAEFFQARANEGKYVILDNSTVELGEPEPLRKYMAKAIAMNVTEVLAPDWLHEKDRTLDSLRETLNLVGALGWTGNIMAVPQGRGPVEVMTCVAEMLEYPIATIGLSRRYTEMFEGSRTGLAEMTSDLIRKSGRQDVKVHLLGCWHRPTQDIGQLLSRSYVRGIDGSLPSVFAKYGMLLDDYTERPGPMIDIIDDAYDVEQLKFNLTAWRRLCIQGGRRQWLG